MNQLPERIAGLTSRSERREEQSSCLQAKHQTGIRAWNGLGGKQSYSSILLVELFFGSSLRVMEPTACIINRHNREPHRGRLGRWNRTDRTVVVLCLKSRRA
jgi:hypothetical protein